MSCCGGKCTCCTSGCSSCGNGCGGCNAYSGVEGTTTSQTIIYTVAPLKGQLEGFGMATGSECGAPNCKCGSACSCSSCGGN